ncbi:MAG: CPBP family intramembrane glutamic endopeptidase [Flavobacteriales bacterium]
MIHFLGIGVAQAISGAMGMAFWKINVFEEAGLELDMADKGIVSFYRMTYILFALFGFIMPALVFRRYMELPDQDYLFIRKRMIWLIAGGVALVFLAAYPVINVLNELNEQVLLPGDTGRAIDKSDKETQMFIMYILYDRDVSVYLTNLLVIAFLPALGEELFFRAVMLRLFTKFFKGIHAAVWIGAIFFSVYHFQFQGLLPRIFMGALLGYVFIITGNIWYSVLLHFLNNAFIVTLKWLQARDFSTEKMEWFGSHDWTRVVAVISLLILVAWGIYSWRKARHYQMESELLYR